MSKMKQHLEDEIEITRMDENLSDEQVIENIRELLKGEGI